MAHPHKTNDSYYQKSLQNVPTDGRTTPSESPASSAGDHFLATGSKERKSRFPIPSIVQKCFRLKSSTAAPRTSHFAATSLPVDDPTNASRSSSAGVHLPSHIQNIPAQFPPSALSQASDDAARHPAPISHPTMDDYTSRIITQPEEADRSPFIQAVAPSNAAPASEVAVNHDGATPNIIVFGESGVGKSSLVNMITGTDSAATSNEAVGCTFQSAPYEAELKGRKYRLWDTIGLNEGERGTASPERSIQDLQRLVFNLQNEGVNLLVYCIRGSRIRDIIKINYDLFWKIICNKQVPIVVVVTGLENEEDMEEWWRANSEDFGARNMRFHGHACVTTTQGKLMKNGEHMYEAEFELSVQLVRDLIVKCCPQTPWKPDGSQWLIDIVQTMKRMFLLHEAQSSRREYGSHGPQARNGLGMPDSLRQYFADLTMGFDVD